MAMLVDKQVEVRDGSVCGLQSGGADGHAGGKTGRGGGGGNFPVKGLIVTSIFKNVFNVSMLRAF